MQLVINGEQRELDNGITLAELLAAKNIRPEMVVVEHNGAILPRTEYASTVLAENDTLEIVQMMAGG